MTTSMKPRFKRLFSISFLSAFLLPILEPISLGQDSVPGEKSGANVSVSVQDDDKTGQESVDETNQEKVNDEFEKADLPPLKRIVMYNSGVGQMQHAGKVAGKQRMEIRFGNHDVNDVLKSIVFDDKGGGSVKAVEYQPAPEPEDVAANRIGQPMTLAQLLHRFRGEKVELERGRFAYSGIIYGVENRTKGNIVEETVILITDEGMEAVGLSDVTKTRFVNDELREEMKLAMAGLAKSRKANTQGLELLLEGEGERDVEFAYVVDMPIWRMTYRLSLLEENATLQGWAHIDNITGVDWQDVTIELRSGKPQAFHINIFDPLMSQRPRLGSSVFDYTVGLTLIQKMFGGSSQENFGEGIPARGLGGGGFFGGSGFGGGLGSRETAGRASQMLSYKLEKPVSLGAGKSAALPVFSNEVPVRQMSIYTDTSADSTPERAIQVTNNSKSPIVSGPISIVGDGDFVGDAKLGRLSVGESAELVFGVDRAVNVSKKVGEAEARLIEARLKENEIQLFREEQTKLSFDAENKDTEKRNVVIKFYLRTVGLNKKALEDYSAEEIKQWFVPAPKEIKDDMLTYEIEVGPQKTETLSIVVSVPSEIEKELLGLDRDTLRQWEKDGVRIAERELNLFNEIVEMTESIEETRKTITEETESVEDYEKDQGRVRSNLEVVLKNPDAAKIYLEKLNQLEKQIEDSKARIVTQRKKLEQLQAEQLKKIEAMQQ